MQYVRPRLSPSSGPVSPVAAVTAVPTWSSTASCCAKSWRVVPTRAKARRRSGSTSGSGRRSVRASSSVTHRSGRRPTTARPTSTSTRCCRSTSWRSSKPSRPSTGKDVAYDSPVPAATRPLGTDVLDYIEAYGDRAPSLVMSQHLAALIGLRLFQLPLRTARATRSLIETGDAPGRHD